MPARDASIHIKQEDLVSVISTVFKRSYQGGLDVLEE